MSLWPDGARAAVSVTVDNLGEAAELQLGLRDSDAPLGGHYSVTVALPIMLELVGAPGLSATFFVEGINAEVYPEALHAIRDAGHEVAYHAWCHEDWHALEPSEEVENLDRGLSALAAIGIDPLGLRPPGGRLTPQTLDLLAERRLSYCSPAGSTLGIDRVAIIPFAWPAVDVFHVLPAFAGLRERVTGNDEAGGADAVRAALLGAVDAARACGGHATLVLHTWMIEFERDAVREVIAQARAGAQAGELWLAPCRDVAAWMTEHPGQFDVPATLDEASWAGS